MVQAPQKTITLDEFLQLPETKPASEYINGAIGQKPMPQGKHSTIQGRLVTVVNHLVQKPQIALALPELRCTFGGRSILPDVAIFVWNRIPLDADGEIANTFNTHIVCPFRSAASNFLAPKSIKTPRKPSRRGKGSSVIVHPSFSKAVLTL